MAQRGARKAARLPSGKYAWRGRAVVFSKLPKREQSRFRSLWATKAAKAAAKERAKGDRKTAREWLQRRSEIVEQQLEHTPSLRDSYPNPLTVDEGLKKLGVKGVLAGRELQQRAHRAYMAGQKRTGGKAAEIADVITEMLGPELARALPQLWWYH